MLFHPFLHQTTWEKINRSVSWNTKHKKIRNLSIFKDLTVNEKRFAFVNDAAEREYKDLPKSIQVEFGTSLRVIQENKKPF